MGQLLYGSPPVACSFDDRVLAHLQVAIITKFRRGEPFVFQLGNEVLEGLGRRVLWLHPSVPLQFVFKTRNEYAVNPAWVAALLVSAQQAPGLRALTEPPPAPTRTR